MKRKCSGGCNDEVDRDSTSGDLMDKAIVVVQFFQNVAPTSRLAAGHASALGGASRVRTGACAEEAIKALLTDESLDSNEQDGSMW